MKPNVEVKDGKFIYKPLIKTNKTSYCERERNKINCLIGIILYGSGIFTIGLVIYYNYYN